jgi:hypothetical protein
MRLIKPAHVPRRSQPLLSSEPSRTPQSPRELNKWGSRRQRASAATPSSAEIMPIAWVSLLARVVRGRRLLPRRLRRTGLGFPQLTVAGPRRIHTGFLVVPFGTQAMCRSTSCGAVSRDLLRVKLRSAHSRDVAPCARHGQVRSLAMELPSGQCAFECLALRRASPCRAKLTSPIVGPTNSVETNRQFERFLGMRWVLRCSRCPPTRTECTSYSAASAAHSAAL